MAGTLTLNLTARLTNGTLKEQFLPSALSVTQTTAGEYSAVVSVGTSEEDLPVGDVATLGWLFIQNIDATNYVTYGPKDSGVMIAFGRIEAGEWAALRLEPGITLRWQANTAAVKVKTILLED